MCLLAPQLKTNGIRLIPFFAAVVLYFATFPFRADDTARIWSTFVKCLPIYCLVLFVLAHGTSELRTNGYYNLKLIVGLLFSSLGDLFLNINMFEWGVGAFGISHLFFNACFGFKPARMRLGIALYSFGLLVNLVLLQFMPNAVLFVMVYIYSNLLITTAWRGVARCDKSDASSWAGAPRLAGAIGGVSFLLSDGLLGVNMFVVSRTYLSVSVEG